MAKSAKRAKRKGRGAGGKPSLKKAVGIGVMAVVLLGVLVEITLLGRKGGGAPGGGGGGDGGCTLTALSQIAREAPIQDMEVAADGTLYAVDIHGLRVYKAGAVQDKMELPWESQPNSSLAVGKTALFVNKPSAPELYRVEIRSKKLTLISIEGAHSLYGIAADGEGKIYVADQTKAVVYSLDETGRLLGTLGGPELEKGGLVRPTDLTVDEKGDVYVIDQGSYRIIRYSSEGKVLKSWKTPWDKATVERIGVLKGRVYVNDHLGSGVFIMSPEGKDLGHCTKVQGEFALVAPGQLAAGKDGYLYVGSHSVGQILP